MFKIQISMKNYYLKTVLDFNKVCKLINKQMLYKIYFLSNIFKQFDLKLI